MILCHHISVSRRWLWNRDVLSTVATNQ